MSAIQKLCKTKKKQGYFEFFLKIKKGKKLVEISP
jgi:hypothetical protein